MIGIVYEKSTGKIRSMIVPENKAEEGALNGNSIRLLDDEAFMLFGDEIKGVPSIHEAQELLNNKLNK
jgi:hypothetical protein